MSPAISSSSDSSKSGFFCAATLACAEYLSVSALKRLFAGSDSPRGGLSSWPAASSYFTSGNSL